MMPYRLFLVEDDPGIADAVCAQAEAWGLTARKVQNFRSVMEEFRSFAPHIVLLDIKLPFFSGYHWCTEIRRESKVPIVFLSSAADNMNIVMAMNLGADDFIAKPFDGSVLIAKLQAILRRCYDYVPQTQRLSFRGAVLETDDQSLIYQENKISLTKNEFRILACLLECKGKIVSRERLMERLWETDSFVDENTLTVNVNRLRKKLESAGLDNAIETKVGVGYLIPAGP